MGITPVLDHATILVPRIFLEDPPPSARELFALAPAGRRGGGQTESMLARFADGTYLEFIAFRPDIDPEARSKHRYGGCAEGTVVDWAIRFAASDAPGPGGESWKAVFDAMQLRVRSSGTGVIYMDPVRADDPEDEGGGALLSFPEHGGHLEWKRELDVVPGEVPHWVLRPPPPGPRDAAEGRSTKHPSGVVGLAGVEVLIRAGPERVRSEHRLGLLWETFQTLFGAEPADVVDEGRQIDTWEWPVCGGDTAHRMILLASPEGVTRNVEVRVGLLKEGGEWARLELDASKVTLDIRLGPPATAIHRRQSYHWEWMR